MKIELYVPYAVVIDDGKPVSGHVDTELTINWLQGDVWDPHLGDWRTSTPEELEAAYSWLEANGH